MVEFASFGEMVKFTRTELGYSLRDLAEKAEVSPSQLSKIERGLATPTEETVNKLAYALNVEKEMMMFLAGYVDKDLKDEIMTARAELAVTNSNKMGSATKVAATGIAAGVAASLLPSAAAVGLGAMLSSGAALFLKSVKESLLAEEYKNLYTVENDPHYVELSEDEKAYLDREMKSAYHIAMKRIMMMRKVGGEQEYVQRSGRLSRGTGDVPVDQRNVDDDTSDRS